MNSQTNERLFATFLFFQLHKYWTNITTFITNILSWSQPIIKACRQMNIWTAAPRTIFFRRLPMVQCLEYSSYVFQQFHFLGLHLSTLQSLKRNVLFRITKLHQKLTNFLAMVSLKHNLTVLRGSTTCAKTFQFLSYFRKIRVLLI